MNNLIGNTKAFIQERRSESFNAIGERINEWVTTHELVGFLDMLGQSTNRSEYKTNLVDSTHIFICNYQEISGNVEMTRMLINNKVYEVLYIDNPMELNKHLEIYLKFVGGQNGQR